MSLTPISEEQEVEYCCGQKMTARGQGKYLSGVLRRQITRIPLWPDYDLRFLHMSSPLRCGGVAGPSRRKSARI